MTEHTNRILALCALAGLVVAALLGVLSPGLALIAGAAITFFFGNPAPLALSRSTKLVLTTAVIGLGAGVEPGAIAAAGVKGAALTIATLTAAVLLGRFISRSLGLDPRTGILVTVGTAICGGSAIAAAAPALHAEDDEISAALGTIFLLNGIALLVFPPIGHLLHLTGEQFGTWSALAIHDMSSVVGTATAFADNSLDVAVPMKLTRALWIIPVTFLVSRHPAAQTDDDDARGPLASIPPVVIGFVVVAILFAVLPLLEPLREPIVGMSHRLLLVAILLIGTAIDRNLFKRTGLRPLLLGVLLWIPLALLSLGLVEWLA